MVTTLQSSVQWRDLMQYQPWEILKELSLPLPWLVLELVCILGLVRQRGIARSQSADAGGLLLLCVFRRVDSAS